MLDYFDSEPAWTRDGWQRHPLLLALLALAPGFMAASSASAAENPLKVSVSAGTAYDDDVTISQLDSSTGQGDGLANFNLTSSYDLVRDKNKTLSVGYSFDQVTGADFRASVLPRHGKFDSRYG